MKTDGWTIKFNHLKVLKVSFYWIYVEASEKHCDASKKNAGADNCMKKAHEKRQKTQSFCQTVEHSENKILAKKKRKATKNFKETIKWVLKWSFETNWKLEHCSNNERISFRERTRLLWHFLVVALSESAAGSTNS